MLCVLFTSLTNESLRKLTEKSDEHLFSAEVPKMMKLIINSVYSNKEVTLSHICVQLLPDIFA